MSIKEIKGERFHGLKITLAVGEELRQRYMGVAGLDEQGRQQVWEAAKKVQKDWEQERGRSAKAHWNGRHKNNICGIVGLSWTYRYKGNGTLENSIKATWRNTEGKSVNRSFAIGRYGIRGAYERAIEARALATHGRRLSDWDFREAFTQFLIAYSMVTGEKFNRLWQEAGLSKPTVEAE